MYRETNKKKSVIDAERIVIADYLRAFLDELAQKEGKRREIKLGFQAESIKGLMNMPKNTAFKSINDIRSGYPIWYEQEVDFVPSNLGKNKGFIFYFICNGCKRRTKYLYFPSMINEPLCRICCRLQYKQPNRRTRALSRLSNKEYLSTEQKYALMKRAEINKGDIDNYLSDYKNDV
jgi:hypothetical protein